MHNQITKIQTERRTIYLNWCPSNIVTTKNFGLREERNVRLNFRQENVKQFRGIIKYNKEMQTITIIKMNLDEIKNTLCFNAN